MTPAVRLTLALIASFISFRISAPLIDNYWAGALIGVLVGVAIIVAVPAKPRAPKG